MGITTTPNIGLKKPDYKNLRWDIPLNENFDTLDNVSESIGAKNEFINGQFDFWQRGYSFSQPGDIADRWRIDSGGGTSFSINRKAFNTMEFGCEVYSIVDINVVSGNNADSNARLEQRIQGIHRFSGKTVCVSFWALAKKAGMHISVGGVQRDNGIVNSNIGVTKIAISANVWKKYSVIIDFPDIGTHIVHDRNVDHSAIIFWFDAGSNTDAASDGLGNQSGSLLFANATLTKSNKEIPVFRRKIVEEELLCQAYFRRYTISNPVVVYAHTNNTCLTAPISIGVLRNDSHGSTISVALKHGGSVNLPAGSTYTHSNSFADAGSVVLELQSSKPLQPNTVGLLDLTGTIIARDFEIK